jgi:bacitracin transport system permease protein
MVLIGFSGSAVTPLVTFLAYAMYHGNHPLDAYSIETLLNETGVYMTLLIATPLYGVLAAWMFNREFVENTMRDLLIVPVRRNSLLVAKLLVLLLWILVLSVWTWFLAVFLGLMGSLPGYTAPLLASYFGRFVYEGLLLFLLTIPIIFATLVLRNYIPVIVITVCLTLVSIMVGNSDYQALYPWTAILTIASTIGSTVYPPWVPYVSIISVSLAGLIGSFVCLNKLDIS